MSLDVAHKTSRAPLLDPAAKVIVLEWHEVLAGCHAGCLRNVQNICADRPAMYGAAQDRRGDFQMHIVGCVGELAVAKLLGIYWPGKGKFRGPDLGNNIGVKCSQTFPYLVLHERDRDDASYYFVWWRVGTFITEVSGPIPGSVIMQAKFFGEPPERPSPGFWYRIPEDRVAECD